MKARTDLFADYAEWRRWTELEGAAILASDWGRVRECQSAKQRLQGRIICDTDQARQECTRLGLKPAGLEAEVRVVVGELIQLETHNGEVLATRRQSHDREQAELECASRNLRRVHRSYGGTRSAGWTSFS
jgi:hypothetical protein